MIIVAGDLIRKDWEEKKNTIVSEEKHGSLKKSQETGR